ncbi:hypothetical protein [Aureimonas ureilytica]|uniref:hypothetical protein n=1 Tax=Aureimonas ureilytica TaxID=401562 RepID=UPI000AE706E1|nr:hypothetical protein [Aureimonas ureilytica]
MSVDLVGSTAYKAGPGSNRDETSMRQAWVEEIRNFYSEFPDLLHRFCLDNAPRMGVAITDERIIPAVWKTIGDELVFCCAVTSLEHLALCVVSFTAALSEYGSTLDSRGRYLDVKGGAWIATFPTDNVIVAVSPRKIGDVRYEELPSEEEEEDADRLPSSYDFLGKGIDTGFRLTRFATSDQCVVSIELAWLLAESEISHKTSIKFSYHNREILKGVHGGRPYPIISINTERNALRRELRDRERQLTGGGGTTPLNIRDFLTSFMNVENIDTPCLPSLSKKEFSLPKAYQDYASKWEIAFKEVEKRSANEASAATVPIQGDTPSSQEDSDENLNAITSSWEKILNNIVSTKDVRTFNLLFEPPKKTDS